MRKEWIEKIYHNKRWVYAGAGILAAVIFVIVLTVVFVGGEGEEPAALSAESLVDGHSGNSAAAASEDGSPKREEEYVPKVDFMELKAENPDVYAWIEIPGTEVDYPILQNETDNYYLDRNMDGSAGYPGCIYTNSCSEKDFSDFNTVIYGHNMKNGSMFASLHKYEEEDFLAENPYIYIYTEEKELKYMIYAATAYTDDYLPDHFFFKSYDGMNEFIKTVDQETYADGMFVRNQELEIKGGDHIITLSTCISDQDTKRYLVIGVLQND